MDKKKTNFIYVCPECEGAAFVLDKKCGGCDGLGAVLLLGKTIYFWGKKISHLQIMQERFTRKARVVINSLFFVFGLIGFLSLLKVLVDLELAGGPIYNFYLVKNELSLLDRKSVV